MGRSLADENVSSVTDPPFQARFHVMKFNRGTWEPTIYSILSPDFCAIMFNENIYWFTNWNKNIANRAEIEEKCINTKDTVITYNPFLMSMELDNVRIPNVHGRYKVVFTFEAFDENNERRPTSLCFEISGQSEKIN
uniref:Uncharacterized protein LOC108039088 n=1 Tax=Drosophila rhopaloa TaxID=1041015 RepID=A0A6P4E0V9_DRORH